jgi:3-hydroxyacyl-[acyl-carrier-protein] dehydratase
LAGKDLIVDLDAIDLNYVVADINEIRKYNPQRFEMEQLSAVIYVDTSRYAAVGYKDVREDEFWVRGHMPGMPLMPGVVMLEAAAQLCSFVTQRYDLLGTDMIGFGGLEDVRFRDPVLPGDRFYLMCELGKVRRGRMIYSKFQGVVRGKIAVDGTLKGIPIPIEALKDMYKKD